MDFLSWPRLDIILPCGQNFATIKKKGDKPFYAKNPKGKRGKIGLFIVIARRELDLEMDFLSWPRLDIILPYGQNFAAIK